MRWHRNMATWEQALSIGVGAGLIAAAARRHRPFSGLATAGVGLVARGATGFCPVKAATGHHDDPHEALAGSRGIRMRESLSIAAPPAELFTYWKRPEHLPLFMKHVERVDDLGGGRTHWVVRGPAGIRLEWDAEVINEIAPELIAWRSLPGADVVSAGSVHFKPIKGNGTEITVVLQYDPPAGKVGAALAWLAGQSPASTLREDLRRLKQLLETGEVPTVDGQPTGHRSTTFNIADWVVRA